MTLMFEISRPLQWCPGLFRGVLERKAVVRVWWLWFAVTWTPTDLPAHLKAFARSGKWYLSEREMREEVQP